MGFKGSLKDLSGSPQTCRFHRNRADAGFGVQPCEIWCPATIAAGVGEAFSDLHLVCQGGIADVVAMNALAAELSAATGAHVEFNTAGVITTMCVVSPGGLSIDVDATIEAVRAAIDANRNDRGSFRSMPDWGPLPTGDY